MARAKDVAKLLRGGVNDKTSPARLAEIMKALRHAEIAEGHYARKTRKSARGARPHVHQAGTDSFGSV